MIDNRKYRKIFFQRGKKSRGRGKGSEGKDQRAKVTEIHCVHTLTPGNTHHVLQTQSNKI